MLIQYAAEDAQTIWGMEFEEGDHVDVDLDYDVDSESQEPDSDAASYRFQKDPTEDPGFGEGGPWGWGGFTTERLEELSVRIRYAGDGSLLWWRNGHHPDSLG